MDSAPSTSPLIYSPVDVKSSGSQARAGQRNSSERALLRTANSTGPERQVWQSRSHGNDVPVPIVPREVIEEQHMIDPAQTLPWDSSSKQAPRAAHGSSESGAGHRRRVHSSAEARRSLNGSPPPTIDTPGKPVRTVNPPLPPNATRNIAAAKERERAIRPKARPSSAPRRLSLSGTRSISPAPHPSKSVPPVPPIAPRAHALAQAAAGTSHQLTSWMPVPPLPHAVVRRASQHASGAASVQTHDDYSFFSHEEDRNTFSEQPHGQIERNPRLRRSVSTITVLRKAKKAEPPPPVPNVMDAVQGGNARTSRLSMNMDEWAKALDSLDFPTTVVPSFDAYPGLATHASMRAVSDQREKQIAKQDAAAGAERTRETAEMPQDVSMDASATDADTTTQTVYDLDEHSSSEASLESQLSRPSRLKRSNKSSVRVLSRKIECAMSPTSERSAPVWSPPTSKTTSPQSVARLRQEGTTRSMHSDVSRSGPLSFVTMTPSRKHVAPVRPKTPEPLPTPHDTLESALDESFTGLGGPGGPDSWFSDTEAQDLSLRRLSLHPSMQTPEMEQGVLNTPPETPAPPSVKPVDVQGPWSVIAPSVRMPAPPRVPPMEAPASFSDTDAPEAEALVREESLQTLKEPAMLVMDKAPGSPDSVPDTPNPWPEDAKEADLLNTQVPADMYAPQEHLSVDQETTPRIGALATPLDASSQDVPGAAAPTAPKDVQQEPLTVLDSGETDEERADVRAVESVDEETQDRVQSAQKTEREIVPQDQDQVQFIVMETLAQKQPDDPFRDLLQHQLQQDAQKRAPETMLGSDSAAQAQTADAAQEATSQEEEIVVQEMEMSAIPVQENDASPPVPALQPALDPTAPRRASTPGTPQAMPGTMRLYSGPHVDENLPPIYPLETTQPRPELPLVIPDGDLIASPPVPLARQLPILETPRAERAERAGECNAVRTPETAKEYASAETSWTTETYKTVQPVQRTIPLKPQTPRRAAPPKPQSAESTASSKSQTSEQRPLQTTTPKGPPRTPGGTNPFFQALPLQKAYDRSAHESRAVQKTTPVHLLELRAPPEEKLASTASTADSRPQSSAFSDYQLFEEAVSQLSYNESPPIDVVQPRFDVPRLELDDIESQMSTPGREARTALGPSHERLPEAARHSAFMAGLGWQGTAQSPRNAPTPTGAASLDRIPPVPIRSPKMGTASPAQHSSATMYQGAFRPAEREPSPPPEGEIEAHAEWERRQLEKQYAPAIDTLDQPLEMMEMNEEDVFVDTEQDSSKFIAQNFTTRQLQQRQVQDQLHSLDAVNATMTPGVDTVAGGSNGPYPVVNRPAKSRAGRAYPGALPQRSLIPPFELQNRTIVPPEPGACLECMMRDEDMIDVVVADPATWERESDGDFYEAIRLEHEQRLVAPQVEPVHPETGGRLTRVRVKKVAMGKLLSSGNLKEHTQALRMSSSQRAKAVHQFVYQQRKLLGFTEKSEADELESMWAQQRKPSAREGKLTPTRPPPPKPKAEQVPIAPAPALAVPLPMTHTMGEAVQWPAAVNSPVHAALNTPSRTLSDSFPRAEVLQTPTKTPAQTSPFVSSAGKGVPARRPLENTPSPLSEFRMPDRPFARSKRSISSSLQSNADVSNASVIDMHLTDEAPKQRQPDEAIKTPAQVLPPSSPPAPMPEEALGDARPRSVKGFFRRMVSSKHAPAPTPTPAEERKVRKGKPALYAPDTAEGTSEGGKGTFWRKIGKQPRSSESMRRFASAPRYADAAQGPPPAPKASKGASYLPSRMPDQRNYRVHSPEHDSNWLLENARNYTP